MGKERLTEKDMGLQRRCQASLTQLTILFAGGRQRANYPKCNVCLEKVEPVSFSHSQAESKLSMGIFKSYDIRGKYPVEIDELTTRKIGTAIAQFFKEKES